MVSKIWTYWNVSDKNLRAQGFKIASNIFCMKSSLELVFQKFYTGTQFDIETEASIIAKIQEH